jgi:hypothetical protein
MAWIGWKSFFVFLCAFWRLLASELGSNPRAAAARYCFSNIALRCAGSVDDSSSARFSWRAVCAACVVMPLLCNWFDFRQQLFSIFSHLFSPPPKRLRTIRISQRRPALHLSMLLSGVVFLSVLEESHFRACLILSVIQLACDTLRALHRSRSLAASCGSRRTVMASRGVSLGLRPAPALAPPLVGFGFISWLSCIMVSGGLNPAGGGFRTGILYIGSRTAAALLGVRSERNGIRIVLFSQLSR